MRVLRSNSSGTSFFGMNGGVFGTDLAAMASSLSTTNSKVSEIQVFRNGTAAERITNVSGASFDSYGMFGTFINEDRIIQTWEIPSACAMIYPLDPVSKNYTNAGALRIDCWKDRDQVVKNFNSKGVFLDFTSSSDGDYLAIGMPNTNYNGTSYRGYVQVYHLGNASPILVSLPQSDAELGLSGASPYFGWSVAISGTTLAVSARDTKVIIFKLNPTNATKEMASCGQASTVRITTSAITSR